MNVRAPIAPFRPLPLRRLPPLTVVVPGRTTQCSSCRIRNHCLPGGLEDADLSRLDGLMFGARRVKEGQTLYREGDPFHFVHAVRSGTFKSSLLLPDGREHVTGFEMTGDMMGLDGLASGRHASRAVALEDGEVCSIPYLELSDLAAHQPGMQHVISRLMSREIVREQGLVTLLAGMNAEERVASFLVSLSRRMKARGFSSREFHLRMSRADIGCHLGLTLETVSRTLSALQQRGYVVVDKKHVRIIDIDGLARVVEMCLQ